MDNAWQPIAELRPGHYAVGLLDDGHEVDILRAGAAILNVATGEKIAGVTSWHPCEFVTDKQISVRLNREALKEVSAMTLVLELPDHKEAVLKARAQAHGVSAEQYVQQIVDRDLEETERDSRSVWDVFAESRKRVPYEEFVKLPRDGADEHDHYLYGHAKQSS